MTEQVGTTDKPLVFSEPSSRASTQQETSHQKSASGDYYSDWLAKQKNLISSLNSGVILLPIDGEWIPAATYQSDSSSYTALNQLVLDNLALTQPQVATLDYNANHGQAFGLLYPVFDLENQRIALVALAIEVANQSELTQALTSLEYSCAGLEVVEYHQRLIQLQHEQQNNSDKIDVLARVLAENSYGAAAVRLVTELAVLFHCDRVSFGEYRQKRCQLKHLSHSAQFGKKMNHVRLIEQAMDECLDQGKIICFPKSSGDHIERAHQALSSQYGDITIVSIPLYLDHKPYGCLLLEANPEQVISLQQVEVCQSLASLVIPTIEEKRLNDRLWLRKTWESATTQLGRVIGPNYLGRKLVLAGGAALFYLLSTVTAPYKLSTQAQIESGVQRAMVAPYDGYIGEALVRAGDVVDNAQTLAVMDDRDLRLEKLKWLSEQSKLNKQYQEAIAIRDRAKINIINAQKEQVGAQLELVNTQIERGTLSSPFAGVVVSGDLSQRLGSAINKGDVLFEVAPSDSYRVRLQIPESRIADLQLGQSGTLHLSALPEHGFAFEISKITPIVEAEEGATYFIAEAQLQHNIDGWAEQLRPGMEGIGKVSVDERLAIAIWTRELTDWVRLQYWSWWG